MTNTQIENYTKLIKQYAERNQYSSDKIEARVELGSLENIPGSGFSQLITSVDTENLKDWLEKFCEMRLAVRALFSVDFSIFFHFKKENSNYLNYWSFAIRYTNSQDAYLQDQNDNLNF
ncbi:hypothetical protein [Leptospira sp. id769339]|uniref:hypothetical protein n=1 Tax=Leptospira sp. id769339 TaxID=2864221 RepID=UPI00214B36FD|nr:hypothetical protein [Leptospira sp. id769339]MCR1795371.1 hypothetical protein [Leptospira sp. id769339]